jgi:predicted aconitase
LVLGKHYWDVPVINGINVNKTTLDELIALCSSIPAYGACVHSLMVGISPEANTLEQAFGGQKPQETFEVGAKEIKGVFNMFTTKNSVPDMVSLGGFGVNVSIESLTRLVQLVEGKKVSTRFPTVCLLDNPVKQVADKAGMTDILIKAGISIGMDDFLKGKGITGSDFSNNPVASANRLGLKTLVFMDAKSCHYIGNQEIEPVLKNLDDCVKIALAGKMEVK